MNIDEIHDLLREKEDKLNDLHQVQNAINSDQLRIEQDIIDLNNDLKDMKEKVPYCPSCGYICTPDTSVRFRCINRNCEDYLTEWEWYDDYHGGLRRH